MTTKLQLERVRQNRCIHCGKRLTNVEYMYWPSLCRVCAKKKVARKKLKFKSN